ncbi:SAM-dependent methyltransferase, partial [Candidatus Entotheonella serta]
MIAREYYNSADADAFYATIWGGEDIHIGLYASASESIFDASRRTVAHMAELAAPITEATRMLDIGSGYGGPARYLAARFGCHVAALNLSEKENERARRLNREHGLEDAIQVIDGAFEDIPLPDASVDRVWSQ